MPYAGTIVVGEGAAFYYRTGGHMSAAQAGEIYVETKRAAIDLARDMIARLRSRVVTRVRELPKIESERLRLELPTVADAQRAAAFYARNRAFFTPWEPTFGADVDTPAFWTKILPGYAEEFQNGYAARLVMRKLDDLDGSDHRGFLSFSSDDRRRDDGGLARL